MHGAALRPRLASRLPLGAPCNFSLSFVFVPELRFQGSSQLPAEIGEYDYSVRDINLLHKSKLT